MKTGEELIRRKIKEEQIYEAILTTPSSLFFNFSAAGFRRKGKEVFLQIFQGSDSYKNLKEKEVFGLTLLSSHKVTPFFKAAVLGWNEPELTEFKKEELEFFCGIPFVKEGIIYLYCKVEERKRENICNQIGSSEVLKIRARIEDCKVKEEEQEVFSRAPALFVEALVHYSKLKAGFEKKENSWSLSQAMAYHLTSLKQILNALKKMGWNEGDYREGCRFLENEIRKWEQKKGRVK